MKEQHVTKGQFVTGFRKGREHRDRISLRKESNLYYEKGKGSARTVTGSAIPSLKTRYVQGLIGMSSDKLYGEKAYLKGMNKRPRMKLTLGNMVMRKKRKRVEGVHVQDTQRVGGQRARQRIRVVWDRVNRERRKTYRAYRRSLRTTHAEVKRDSNMKASRNELIRSRDRYQVVRACEVYRNSYEVRSRYQTHERGQRRQQWRLESKFHTQVTEKTENERKTKPETWLENGVRVGLRHDESRKRDEFHGKRREEVKQGFEQAYAARTERVREQTGRRKISHVRTLLNRSDQTSTQPIQRKNRVQRFNDDPQRTGKSAPVIGVKEFGRKDEENQILRAAPTTQYFAKVKNLVRMIEMGSDEAKDSPSTQRVKKRRKVPEKKRNQRYPGWTELDVWSNRLMQKVEDENLKKVLKGEEVNLSYATYREFGKKVRYLYAVERTDRMDKEIK